LVHLYTDGTVLVSHGGTEMGQGLHTKVCQVAAQAFEIPLDDVYVNDSSTDKVANTIPTAASMSTDLYGMATLDACRQILKRLEPIRASLGPKASLKDVSKAAHFARIDLTAHGFYAPSDSRCGFDFFQEKPDDYPADKPENSWKVRTYVEKGISTEQNVSWTKPKLNTRLNSITSVLILFAGASIVSTQQWYRLTGEFPFV